MSLRAQRSLTLCTERALYQSTSLERTQRCVESMLEGWTSVHGVQSGRVSAIRPPDLIERLFFLAMCE